MKFLTRIHKLLQEQSASYIPKYCLFVELVVLYCFSHSGCCVSTNWQTNWQNSQNILFLFLSIQVKNLLDMSVLAFVPAIFLGILGGLLGALFVFLNIKINKLRMWFFSTIPKTSLRKTAKLLEAVLILVSI